MLCRRTQRGHGRGRGGRACAEGGGRIGPKGKMPDGRSERGWKAEMGGRVAEWVRRGEGGWRRRLGGDKDYVGEGGRYGS